MDSNKMYSVCTFSFNKTTNTFEQINVRISTTSPEAAKEGAEKYWRSKGIEPMWLGSPFEVMEI